MNGPMKFLDSLLTYISRLSAEPAASFCELETGDRDGKTLIASDGSLVTVLRVLGSARLVGKAEFADMVDRMSSTLNSFMKESGHSLQIHFTRDPDGASEVVRRALEPARNQADQLNLDFKDLIDEKERELTKYVSHEGLYFVLWTHPGVLAPSEGKAARNQQKQEMEDFNSLRLLDAQNPRVLLSGLRNRHSSYVTSLLAEMRDINLVAEELDSHEALYEIRYCVDPDFTPRSWRAILPGDKIPVKFPMRSNDHMSVWWPSLDGQVWPRDAKTLDSRFVEIGDRVHAPMYMSGPPAKVEQFQRLLTRSIGLDAKMPWSISFLIKGNGLKKIALKQTMASVFAVANSDNPFIRDAIKELQEYAKDGAVVGLQVAFNTWAPIGQTDLLRQRASRMAQAVIDWGSAEVREVTGDPVEGYTSTALGLTARSVASEAASPLLDVMHMIPLTRPASPWRTGAELFTSPDGKLMPFQPGSSLQTTWISLFFGGPGSGKSMQMFKQHFATCLQPAPGQKLLPMIAIIDIGPSSSGLVSVLKNALPASMQHYVNHYRLRNTVEYACNPFDLQLGCEFPLPEERGFLVDFMTMLATPPETGKPYEGTAEIAGMIIDEMYRSLANSDRGKPHEYHPGVDPMVDKHLQKHGIKIEENTSWYEVRDLLYAAGNSHAALLAQRYAVPILSDAASAARSPAVRDVYGKKLTAGEGSESLPEAFSRMINSATREYQILSQPTRFDIGESRVTVFDLDEVAKGGGPGGAKQTAIMYALSMYLLGRNFTLTKDNLSDIPAKYRPYHHPRIQAANQELKTICCDEFHRTSGGFSQALRERVKVYGREGRKWNLQVMLGSQRLSDFDPELIDMATSIYIMERPDDGLVQEYTDRFGLSETEQFALRNGVKGPRAGGATFFARMKTKEGYFNQLLRNPAGPLELWAAGTTSEDKSIREVVYQILGPSDGRMALAMAYPGGSAKRDCDARKESMILKGVPLGDDGEGNIYTIIGQEVVEGFQKRRNEMMRGAFDSHLMRASDKARAAQAAGEKAEKGSSK
jgi:intracellular multiplication protein IcmB